MKNTEIKCEFPESIQEGINLFTYKNILTNFARNPERFGSSPRFNAIFITARNI